MTGWGGDVAARYIRFIYSNEPVARLTRLRLRLRLEAALSGRPAP
jgi:hypothetical protein